MTVSLFDARHREFVRLPPAAAGPVVVRFAHRATGNVHSVDEERGIVFAEMLCRLLVWKGYQVDVQDRPRTTGPGARTHCIEVSTRDVATTDTEPLCQMRVGPALCAIRCMFIAHQEHGRPTLAALVRNGFASDFRFAMLAAGRYRRSRNFHCDGIHNGTCFQDARTTRRRFEGLVRRAGSLPEIQSYADAVHMLPAGVGRKCLDLVDQALNDDLHTTRALHTLYATLRRGQLSGTERAVLAAAAAQLFVPRISAPGSL
jgi:hypothetical protein